MSQQVKKSQQMVNYCKEGGMLIFRKDESEYQVYTKCIHPVLFYYLQR